MNADVGDMLIISAGIRNQTAAGYPPAAFRPSRFGIKSHLSGIFLTAFYAHPGELTAYRREPKDANPLLVRRRLWWARFY